LRVSQHALASEPSRQMIISKRSVSIRSAASFLSRFIGMPSREPANSNQKFQRQEVTVFRYEMSWNWNSFYDAVLGAAPADE
jgi:hypothetical protein